jgi:hypothetical protein
VCQLCWQRHVTRWQAAPVRHRAHLARHMPQADPVILARPSVRR